MTEAPCPLPRGLVDDYFADDLDDADALALEEHVFACDACAALFDRAGTLAVALRQQIPPVISHARARRLEASGNSLKVTPIAPETPTSVEFSLDVDLLVHALRVDLTDASRVGLQFCAPDGAMLFEFEDVPFDADRGEVLVACQRHYMDTFPPRSVFRIVETSGDQRRALGEYVVDHLMP